MKRRTVFAASARGMITLSVLVIIYSIAVRDEPLLKSRGNRTGYPVNFIPGHTIDPVSKMLIRRYENSAEAVLANGDTYFFGEPADMILWIDTHHKETIQNIWVYTQDTHRWLYAPNAWYATRENTPVGYGIGAREHRCRHCIPYSVMKQRVLEGETLLNPRIRKRLLEDNYPN